MPIGIILASRFFDNSTTPSFYILFHLNNTLCLEFFHSNSTECRCNPYQFPKRSNKKKKKKLQKDFRVHATIQYKGDTNLFKRKRNVNKLN